MIYVCLPSRDEASTLGLVLWKIRRVFEAIDREYQVLVADDGSTDDTAQVLERYGEVLPMIVIRHREPKGYAATVEALLRRALELTDRPKRDCAIVMHADYVHRPEHLADAVRAIDGGADVVIGECPSAPGLSGSHRLVRRFGARWLRSAVQVPGVRDPISGFVGFRLATLRHMLEHPEGRLTCEGWASNAELLALAGAQARRVDTFPMTERHDQRERPSRIAPWSVARALVGSRRRVATARARATTWAAERPASRPEPREGRPARRRGRRRRS